MLYLILVSLVVITIKRITELIYPTNIVCLQSAQIELNEQMNQIALVRLVKWRVQQK